jgi:hypothetical protein
VAICEACGTRCPAGAAFCAACGHRLGAPPPEPAGTPVRLAGALVGDCLSCFTWVVALVVLFFLVVWLFSC